MSLNSLATGPKTRVPLISPVGLRRTQAFSSKRMYEPSGLRTSFFVLTTTAVDTCPFLTVPEGEASFTVTTILSPIDAYRLFVPPKTRIVSTSFAPCIICYF